MKRSKSERAGGVFDGCGRKQRRAYGQGGRLYFQKKLEKKAPGLTIGAYLEQRIRLYYTLCRVIDIRTYVLALTGMEEYEKNHILQDSSRT